MTNHRAAKNAGYVPACPRRAWWWPFHRWAYDGPAGLSIAPSYMRRCQRCGVRQQVIA